MKMFKLKSVDHNVGPFIFCCWGRRPEETVACNNSAFIIVEHRKLAIVKPCEVQLGIVEPFSILMSSILTLLSSQACKADTQQ